MTLHRFPRRDADSWRILVRHARIAAGEPGSAAKAGAFRRACASTQGYAPPVDDAGVAELFEKLRGWGDAWWWLTPSHRAEEAHALRHVAWCCAVALGDDADPSPTPPPPEPPPAAAAAARLPYHDDSFDEDAA